MTSRFNRLVTRLGTKRGLAVGLLILAVFLAGCTASYDTTVGSNGTIEQIDIELDIGEQGYNIAAQQAAEADQDYDNVSAYLFTGGTEEGGNIDASNWDSVTLRDDGESTVGISASGGPQAEDIGGGNVMTRVDDTAGEVTYIDGDPIEEESQNTTTGAELSWEYTVRMPGEIIDTNGEVTGAGVVSWTDEDNANVSEYRVTSEQTGVEQSQGGGDGFGPGFGVVAAVAGLLSGALAGLLGGALARSRARNRANN